jgi:hypothetical protein
MTIFVFEVWWYASLGMPPRRQYSAIRYFVGSILSLVIYFPLVAWLSMWIGLKVKTQARAMIVSILTLTAWCGIPIFIAVFAHEALRYGNDAMILFCLGPSGMILINEVHEFPLGRGTGEYPFAIWITLLGNYVVYAACVMLFRWLSLRHAERYLGRREDDNSKWPQPHSAATDSAVAERAVSVS